jgi:hypothetical protein
MEPSIWDWIYDLRVSQMIAEGAWQFPALEVIHIYSMIFLITAVTLFDLSFMGFPVGSDAISRVAKMALRWTWVCFGINALSGTLLFMSRAPEYAGNWAFQLKLALVFVGMIAHTVILRKAVRWETVPSMGFGSKLLVGGISLLIWVGVIIASRWIAYAIPEFL